jgi:WD40 repeat protein
MSRVCSVCGLTGVWLLLAAAPTRPAEPEAVSFWDRRGEVRLFAAAPTGQTLATVSGDAQDRVSLWDLSTFTRKHELNGDPTGTKPTVIVWDVATGKKRRSFDFNDAGPVHHLAFRPDGRALAAAADDGTVSLWVAGHRGKGNREEPGGRAFRVRNSP